MLKLVAGRENEKTARIGAVVIGRNEGERLGHCLESVLSQIPTVVYVDSGSTDGSIDLARRLGVHTIKLDAARPFTAARGRQAGLLELRKLKPQLQLVQFIDGDCVLQQDWILDACAVLESYPDVVAVCGRRREARTVESFYSRIVDVDWDIPPGEVPYFGGDALCRAAAIEAVQWSEELIAGEEPDLCFRLRAHGGRIWRLARDATQHDVAMTSLRQYWRRAQRSGFAYAQVGWRHRRGFGSCWAIRSVTTVICGIVLPLLIVVAIFFWWPAVLLAALAYARLAIALVASCRRRGRPWRVAVAYAALNTLCKTAGALGIIQSTIQSITGRKQELIEYRLAHTR